MYACIHVRVLAICSSAFVGIVPFFLYCTCIPGEEESYECSVAAMSTMGCVEMTLIRCEQILSATEARGLLGTEMITISLGAIKFVCGD